MVAVVFAFMAVQGLLVKWAIVSGSAIAWTLWAICVAAAVAGFMVESLAERRRRR